MVAAGLVGPAVGAWASGTPTVRTVVFATFSGFSPARAPLTAGEGVRWYNQGSLPVTISSTSGHWSFRMSVSPGGFSAVEVLTTPGTYSYTGSTLVSSAAGTVVVSAAPATPSSTPQPSASPHPSPSPRPTPTGASGTSGQNGSGGRPRGGTTSATSQGRISTAGSPGSVSVPLPAAGSSSGAVGGLTGGNAPSFAPTAPAVSASPAPRVPATARRATDTLAGSPDGIGPEGGPDAVGLPAAVAALLVGGLGIALARVALAWHPTR